MKESYEHLKNKYFNGESTPEEELELKSNSQKMNNSNNLQAEKEIFEYISNQAGINNLNKEFEKKVLKKIQENKKIKLIKYFSSFAAIFIMYIGIFLFNTNSVKRGIVINNNNINEHRDEAINEINKACLILTTNIDKVNSQLNKIEYIDITKNRLNKIFDLKNKKFKKS